MDGEAASLISGSPKDSICRAYNPNIDHEACATQKGDLPCRVCGLTSDQHLRASSCADDRVEENQKISDLGVADNVETGENDPLLGKKVKNQTNKATDVDIASMASTLQIPSRYVGSQFSITRKDPYCRKYVKFDGAHDQNTLISLITSLMKWGVTAPSFILSVTGGSLADVKKKELNSIAESIKSLSASTDLWILSDGRNAGTSLFLGRLFHSENNTSKVPVLVSITDWESLHRNDLLMGSRPPLMETTSRYFYDIEYRLAQIEDRSVLNPYQQVYLLLDNGEADPGNTVREFRNAFQADIENFSPNDVFEITETKVPLITLVLGGDEYTLGQVVDSVKSKNIVLVVNRSGHIPSVLSDIYFLMEDTMQSKQSYSEVNSSEEMEDFKKCIRQLSKEIREAFSCDIDEDDSERTRLEKNKRFENIVNQLQEVMMDRFYIMVTDVTDNFNSTLLRAVYKRGTRMTGLSVALKTESPEFLQALFSKDVQRPSRVNNLYLDLEILACLHRGNFSEGSPTRAILCLLCKRKARKGMRNRYLMLQGIGRILHLLLGPKYRLLYHDLPYTAIVGPKEEHENIGDKQEQIFHLFLWSVLSGKPSLTHFFLLRGTAQLGFSLLAMKLYSRLAECASKLYQLERKKFFSEASSYFEKVSVDILDEMYKLNENDAYKSLTSEMPFNLGPQVTPLMVANDAEAMQFMQHTCCQTYLRRVWKGNMVLETPKWMTMAVFAPFIVVPLIDFKGDTDEFFLLNEMSDIDEESETDKESEPEPDDPLVSEKLSLYSDASYILHDYFVNSMFKKKKKRNGKSFWWKLRSYYTAPITKFYTRMFFYLTLLVLISYFILVDLKPINGLSDITVVEWLIIFWITGFAADEVYQIVIIRHAGPLYEISAKTLKCDIWHRYEIIKMKCYIFYIHFSSGGWNTIDISIIVLYIIAFSFRYSLPFRHFQLVRIVFSVALIISYFRLLRFWYVLKSMGSRIIAITMMLTELIKFMLLLSVFIVSFGIAFQAILEPGQEPSMQLLINIIWRPYWQMFGELFLEEFEGIGTNENSTCQYEVEGESRECFMWAGPALLSVYLLISNVLLLNLLIAIFSQTYDKVKDDAQTVWMYNMYNTIEEFYYLPWLPPPLALFYYAWAGVRWCCNSRGNSPRDPSEHPPKFPTDKFRRQALPEFYDLQRESCDGLKVFRNGNDN